MLLTDYLDKETIRKLNQLRNTTEKKEARPRDKPRMKSEVFSQRELEELMGKFQDIYVRKNGAIRRR